MVPVAEKWAHYFRRSKTRALAKLRSAQCQGTEFPIRPTDWGANPPVADLNLEKWQKEELWA